MTNLHKSGRAYYGESSNLPPWEGSDMRRKRCTKSSRLNHEGYRVSAVSMITKSEKFSMTAAELLNLSLSRRHGVSESTISIEVPGTRHLFEFGRVNRDLGHRSNLQLMGDQTGHRALDLKALMGYFQQLDDAARSLVASNQSDWMSDQDH